MFCIYNELRFHNILWSQSLSSNVYMEAVERHMYFDIILLLLVAEVLMLEVLLPVFRRVLVFRDVFGGSLYANQWFRITQR